MMLTPHNLREAKVDLDKLWNPARGGFNLLYNDGWFAQSLIRKWGMSTDELSKKVKAMEAGMAPNAFQKVNELPRQESGQLELVGI